MSRRDRYPEISYSRIKRPRQRCACPGCENPGRYWAEIRSSYMRGDDDVFVICHEHRAEARAGDPPVFLECERVYKLMGKWEGE